MPLCGGAKEHIVDKLLECKATVDAQDNINFTPLMYACRCHHFSITKKLMDNKADLNLICSIKQTALYKARDNLDLMLLLIDAGAKIIPNDWPVLEKIMQPVDWNWEAEVETCNKKRMILEKFHENIITYGEKCFDLANQIKTFIDKLQKVSEIPEMVWESVSSFPLENGRVPLDVTNLCVSYLGFFSDKYKTEVETPPLQPSHYAGRRMTTDPHPLPLYRSAFCEGRGDFSLYFPSPTRGRGVRGEGL